MDKRVKIKEEYPLSDDIATTNQQELFHELVTMNTNNEDVPIKTEIKSEIPFTKHLIKESMFETVTCSNNWEINYKTEVEEQTLISDFSSQKETECLPQDSEMKDKKYKTEHEMYNKIEIKEEPWYLQTGNSSAYDSKDEDFSLVKSSRLPSETDSAAISGISALAFVNVSGRDKTFSHGMDNLEFQYLKSTTDLPTATEYLDSEPIVKCSDMGERHVLPLITKQKVVQQKGKGLHKCDICDKNFTCLSQLKTHNLIHEGIKPHQCKTCYKSFTQLGHLKTHNSIHESEKPYQCKTCSKTFTQLFSLKRHNRIHDGKKAYQCKNCNKTFTLLSNLETHNLFHKGKKPYQCATCSKTFTRMSHLKTHNLIHEGRKAYKCKICGKSFTQLGHLKRHNVIHEGTKAYECEICSKTFTQLSNLKRHNMLHDGKKE